ncbi:MAG TPA: hypothetical protein VMW09_02000 [Desulfatiglandales bacterium]|nr:hypothetical protein [Desulfatiglandales bacterium]
MEVDIRDITNTSEIPIIGIIGWEAGNEDTLSQFEQINGNIAHPDTFSFPVLYKRVKGAYYQTVVVQPNAKVLSAMIRSAQEMEQDGVKAIMTTCGFNAIFQRELSNAVDVPVFASRSLSVLLLFCPAQSERYFSSMPLNIAVFFKTKQSESIFDPIPSQEGLLFVLV